MGEMLLATSIILLAAVLYYVKKNNPSNKKTSIYNPNINDNNNSINHLNRIQNSNFSNYNTYDYGIYTPDKGYLGQDPFQQRLNTITPLYNENLNTPNNININKNFTLTLQNSNQNKIKIINKFITPIKDDSFIYNNYRGPGLNEFTSAVSRPELLHRNQLKSYDDNYLNSDIHNKRMSKYSDDSPNGLIIKDLSKKPKMERLQEIVHNYKDSFLNSKYLNLNFYKNLLIFMMQSIIEYIKGEVDVNLEKRTLLNASKNPENKRESFNNNRNKNDLNIMGINRNLGNADLKYEDSEIIKKHNDNFIDDLRCNMIPINENSVQDLNEYIKNNDQKKLKVRDLIFSDHNTHENFSQNRNFLNKDQNNIPAYIKEKINYSNSLRENVFDKNSIPNYNERKIKQTNDKFIYLGNKEGMNTYYLKPRNNFDWEFDAINFNKKSSIDKKKIFNPLKEEDADIFNRYLNKNDLKDLKTDFHFDENFDLEGNDIVNKNPLTSFINNKEKLEALSSQDYNHDIKFNDNKSLNQDFIKTKPVQTENPANNFNDLFQTKLLREFTPKNNNVNLKNTKSGKEPYIDKCKAFVDNTEKRNKQTYKSPSNIKLEKGVKQPLVKIVENEEGYNSDNNYCEKIETLNNNKFSELLINQNATNTQIKTNENNFFESRKYDLEKVISKVKTGERIRSSIFIKSDDKNHNEDQNESISLNYENSENKLSNNDIIPSPTPSEKINQIANLTQKLPSTIKKNDVVNSNFLLSSGNKPDINKKKDSQDNSLEKALIDYEIEDNKHGKITISSDNKDNELSINNRNNCKSKKEASNFRKRSNKKMTFAPSEYEDFSELELNKSKEKKVVSMIPEENESNLTKTNLINTPSINIKSVNFHNTKEKNNPSNHKNQNENRPEYSLLKENLPPLSKI